MDRQMQMQQMGVFGFSSGTEDFTLRLELNKQTEARLGVEWSASQKQTTDKQRLTRTRVCAVRCEIMQVEFAVHKDCSWYIVFCSLFANTFSTSIPY